MSSSNDNTLDEILQDADVNQAQNERIKARQRAEHQRRTIRDLQAELKIVNLELDQQRDKVAALEELRSPVPKPKALKKRKKKKAGDKMPASFVALASDWHTCELVHLHQTNGSNEHNEEIGIERAWKWADGVATMLERELMTCDIETFVLWLGGDFLVNDGMRYKAELATRHTPFQETRIVRDLLGEIIQYFRSRLDVPRIVIPTSFGNHDRSTPLMLPGHAADYSHIQEAYRDLASWFATSDDTIEFRIAESDYDIVDIHGYRILFHHGHEVNFGGGHSGLAIPISKTIASLQKDHVFDVACFGHYHQWGMFPMAMMNGSLVGANGYSKTKKFATELPAQMAFLIDHRRQQIANFYKIWGV